MTSPSSIKDEFISEWRLRWSDGNGWKDRSRSPLPRFLDWLVTEIQYVGDGNWAVLLRVLATLERGDWPPTLGQVRKEYERRQVVIGGGVVPERPVRSGETPATREEVSAIVAKFKRGK